METSPQPCCIEALFGNYTSYTLQTAEWCLNASGCRQCVLRHMRVQQIGSGGGLDAMPSSAEYQVQRLPLLEPCCSNGLAWTRKFCIIVVQTSKMLPGYSQ